MRNINIYKKASGNDDISTGLEIAKFISGIFGGNKPNPNDWMGWDDLDFSMGGTAGSSVYYWIINDGDSVQNEAANILSYITKKQDGLKNVISSANSQYGNSNVQDVMNKLYSKLQRGGYGSEVDAIKKGLASKIPKNIKPKEDNSKNNGNKPIKKDTSPKKSKPNYWLIGGISLVGVVVLSTVIYFISKKK